MHLGQGLLQALFTQLSEVSTHTSATLLMKTKCNGKPRHRGTANKLHDTAALKYTVSTQRHNNCAIQSGQCRTSLYLPVKDNVHCIFNNNFSMLKQTR